MKNFSFFDSINDHIGRDQQQLRKKIADLLDIDMNNLDKIILEIIGIVSSCTYAGLNYGIQAGDPIRGTISGFVFGLIIVIGTLTYKIYIDRHSKKITVIPIST